MTPVKASSRFFHRTQIAQARRFLRAHLGDALTVTQVARAASASPAHFSRLYHAFCGETIFATLTRFRLEQSARLLTRDRARSVSDIALEVGYATPSAFNRAFKTAFGTTPSLHRRQPPARLVTPPLPVARLARAFRLSRTPTFRTRGPTRVAYVREQGEYGAVAAPLAWQRLSQCLPFDPAHRRIGVSHDDPADVVTDALRYDAGIVLEPRTPPPEGTEVATWPGGRHAVFEFRGPYRLIAHGFAKLFREWVWPGRLAIRPGPFLELYAPVKRGAPEASWLTELWLPVTR